MRLLQIFSGSTNPHTCMQAIRRNQTPVPDPKVQQYQTPKAKTGSQIELQEQIEQNHLQKQWLKINGVDHKPYPESQILSSCFKPQRSTSYQLSPQSSTSLDIYGSQLATYKIKKERFPDQNCIMYMKYICIHKLLEKYIRYFYNYIYVICIYNTECD